MSGFRSDKNKNSMETPEFFQGGGYNSQFTPGKQHLSDTQPGDHFVIEDLDFPNDEPAGAEATFDTATGISTNSTITAVDRCNSSFSGGEPHFAGDNDRQGLSDGQFSSDLCVQYNNLAELEWIPNFMEESFSAEDLQRLQLISEIKAQTNEETETHEFQPDPTQKIMFNPEMSVPGKARSKRSRVAPCKWAARLLVSFSTTTTTTTTSTSSESEIASSSKKRIKPTLKNKGGLENTENSTVTSGGDGRRCLHCATDETPQWRLGPMGPKTLCNACGVRHKLGRLVPEYRPAASPTFVPTKHSNSHRKVLELRTQKEGKGPTIPATVSSSEHDVWHGASRLLVNYPTTTTTTTTSSTSSKSDIASSSKKRVKPTLKKKEGPENPTIASGSDGRRCLHCATDKTPQWRPGPMGPKTLCNACAVRYRSGRLVPEYRPAASPTFVPTKHSNSHRGVLELRRQKETERPNHTSNSFFEHDV